MSEPICPIHKCPLDQYEIKGGRWLGENKGFDTTPQILTACPECEYYDRQEEGQTNV
jgi:hypothetical protein